MGESTQRRDSILQLLAVAALLIVGYACIRTLRFTNHGFNLAFGCLFLLTPFLALRPALRLSRWPKVFLTFLLAPLLTVSLVLLLFTVTCDVPVLMMHRELSRELSKIQQGRYSVHLLWEESAAGAVGPHGVALEQRMSLTRGLYLVKELDYFEGANEGSISFEGTDRVRLHIPDRDGRPGIEKLYLLKGHVHF